MSAKKNIFALLLITAAATPGMTAPEAAPQTATTKQAGPTQDTIVVEGRDRSRFLVKKLVAPVDMNLEKLQDFPEDPAQQILLNPLPISLIAEFNPRSEIKGHAPFWPWIPPVPEPPFLRQTPPKLATPPSSWTFEILNPGGQTIYRQRGTNTLPEELVWEGKDSERKFAVVDRLYSCQLTILDAQGKSTVVQGRSVILPSMAYGSDDAQTIEVSLERLFTTRKAELSTEGLVLLNKIFENLRERGLQKIFLRVAQDQAALATQRENVLVEAVQKGLHLSEGQVKHDHTNNVSARGEIASFWLKGAAQ